MLASFGCQDLQVSPVRPGEVIQLVADTSYNQGRSDVWFLASVLLGAGAVVALLNGDKITPMLLGASLGSMWNAYDSARSAC
jgi:hypothetical protein